MVQKLRLPQSAEGQSLEPFPLFQEEFRDVLDLGGEPDPELLVPHLEDVGAGRAPGDDQFVPAQGRRQTLGPLPETVMLPQVEERHSAAKILPRVKRHVIDFQMPENPPGIGNILGRMPGRGAAGEICRLRPADSRLRRNQPVDPLPEIRTVGGAIGAEPPEEILGPLAPLTGRQRPGLLHHRGNLD